jgi:hypothetical protein
VTGVTVLVVLHPPLEADEPLVTRDETANTLHANKYFKAHMQVAVMQRIFRTFFGGSSVGPQAAAS